MIKVGYIRCINHRTLGNIYIEKEDEEKIIYRLQYESKRHNAIKYMSTNGIYVNIKNIKVLVSEVTHEES